MKLINESSFIEKKECLLEVKAVLDRNIKVPKVICVGKYEWEKNFPTIYGGYGILHEKYLLDLPGDKFLLFQINEHSRGAHCEYEFYLLNVKGVVLADLSSEFHTSFALDNKYIWFLKSGEKKYRIGENKDLDLIQFQLDQAKIKQKIKLNYAELLKCKNPNVGQVKIVEKDGDCFLDIWFLDKDQENKRQTVSLHLSDFR
jgi:hypothetical protein